MCVDYSSLSDLRFSVFFFFFFPHFHTFACCVCSDITCSHVCCCCCYFCFFLFFFSLDSPVSFICSSAHVAWFVGDVWVWVIAKIARLFLVLFFPFLCYVMVCFASLSACVCVVCGFMRAIVFILIHLFGFAFFLFHCFFSVCLCYAYDER